MVFFGFPRIFLFFFDFGSPKAKKNLGNFWFFEFIVSKKRKHQKLSRKILVFWILALEKSKKT